MRLGDALGAKMVGGRGALLALVLKTTALTVSTLGLYSFWGRTRIRRWLWSSFHVDGVPFEYVGRPLEKLSGFVIAAVIVAVYLGLLVMVLVFISLNLFETEGPGIAAAFALVLPVYWYAQYRGLRYLLNHTRWRGIAFSMVPGAWGYAWRATLWSAATILSAGLLLPVRTRSLWRFRAERSFYGDDHFRLAAPLGPLYAAVAPLLAGLFLAALGAWLRAGVAEEAGGLFLAIGTCLAFLGWFHWRARSFGILASNLQFGSGLALTAAPRTGRVLWIHVGGWLAIAGILIIGLLVAVFAFGIGIASIASRIDLETLQEELSDLPPILFFVMALVFYLAVFVMRGALRVVFVSLPLFRHVAETLRVNHPLEVNAVRRGAPAHMADADGFANLFDMGSGI